MDRSTRRRRRRRARIRGLIALAKKVDHAVVGFHWGLEHENYPWAAQTSEAHAVLTPHGVKATLVPV
jgi:hypothetical protein